MPIFARKTSKWNLIENVHAYTGNKLAPVPHRVIAAYLYQSTLPLPPVVAPNQKPRDTQVKHKLFDFSTPPPAVVGLVGVSPPSTDPNHHVRATLSWTAAPKAVSYNVYRSTPGAPKPTLVHPSPLTTPSYVFTGLSPNTTYTFWVTYLNEFGIESVSSKVITLKTGMAKVVATSTGYPANPTSSVPLRASSSDTWNKSHQWGNAYQVTQGYLSNSADRGYGCINYYGGYAHVAALLETMYAAKWGAGIGTAILDHLDVAAPENATVVDATFSRVTQLRGCSAGNNVYIYPAHFSYSSGTTAPTTAGSGAYFDAPGPGNMKHNFRTIDYSDPPDNSHLLLWAKNLIKKVQVHNGLMIYRSDTTNTSGEGYAGYCVLQSKSDPDDTDYDWRINVWLKFSFTFKPYVAPVWS